MKVLEMTNFLQQKRVTVYRARVSNESNNLSTEHSEYKRKMQFYFS